MKKNRYYAPFLPRDRTPRIYSATEARRRLAAILDGADDGNVVITHRDGRKFRLGPIPASDFMPAPLVGSPLVHIPHKKKSITTSPLARRKGGKSL